MHTTVAARISVVLHKIILCRYCSYFQKQALALEFHFFHTQVLSQRYKIDWRAQVPGVINPCYSPRTKQCPERRKHPDWSINEIRKWIRCVCVLISCCISSVSSFEGDGTVLGVFMSWTLFLHTPRELKKQSCSFQSCGLGFARKNCSFDSNCCNVRKCGCSRVNVVVAIEMYGRERDCMCNEYWETVVKEDLRKSWLADTCVAVWRFLRCGEVKTLNCWAIRGLGRCSLRNGSGGCAQNFWPEIHVNVTPTTQPPDLTTTHTTSRIQLSPCADRHLDFFVRAGET